MRRWMAASVGLAAAVILTSNPSEARAQPKPPTEETIPTADGVKLRGLFHKSPKGDSTSPVVILLYPPGLDRNMTKGDWVGLANKLNDAGFHVMRFDWRGHGKSTDITDPMTFWTNPFSGPANNRYIKGGNRRPLKNTLFVKEIDPRYFPVYVNDLAAVRAHLDQKNDQSDLNASSIYIIGSEETAALTFFWLTFEWNRPAIHPILPAGLRYDTCPMPGVVVDPSAGKDIAGCIWLSGGRPTFSQAINERIMQLWVKNTLDIRDNNPMLFLFGQKDGLAIKQANMLFNDVLVAAGNKQRQVKKLEMTFERPIAGTPLRGVNLLGDNSKLGTEDKILDYLKFLQKERVSITRKERKYQAPYFLNMGRLGINP